MKIINCLCLLLLILVVSARAQQQKFASLGDFKLENGETIKDCQIGYRTFGALDAQKSDERKDY